jgi:hypothetical protein
LLAGHENTVEVLIRVQAPDQPKTGLPERQPLSLSIVIDRSGSMEGKPGHEANRAATFMIDSPKEPTTHPWLPMTTPFGWSPKAGT